MEALIKKSLAVTALLMAPLMSHAALVDNGAYLTDTDQQIDFLKLSASSGYTYNAAVHGDATGYIAQGWQIMSQTALSNLTDAERLQLTQSSGLPPQWLIWVHTDQAVTGDPAVQITGYINTDRLDMATGALEMSYAYFHPGFPNQAVLVGFSRPSPVPLPAAGWLFMSAFAGLLGKKRLSRR